MVVLGDYSWLDAFVGVWGLEKCQFQVVLRELCGVRNSAWALCTQSVCSGPHQAFLVEEPPKQCYGDPGFFWQFLANKASSSMQGPQDPGPLVAGLFRLIPCHAQRTV